MSTVKPATIASFKTMWNRYPQAVVLLNKSRDVLAVNKFAEGLGIPAGGKCFAFSGRDNICAGCKGNAALHKSTTMRDVSYSEALGQCLDTYWIPVEGEDDVFVHFGNDISEYVRSEFMNNDE